MTRFKLLSIAMVLALGAFGCSLITDFDKKADGGTPTPELYRLSTNLGTAIDVELQGNGTGMLYLVLATPLPAEGDDAARLALLPDTIGLTVTNTETDVSFELSEGQQATTVISPGDYNVTLDAARTTITIEFFNEIEGASLRVDGSYLAAIDVLANDYFVTETFTRNVTVSSI